MHKMQSTRTRHHHQNITLETSRSQTPNGGQHTMPNSLFRTSLGGFCRATTNNYTGSAQQRPQISQPSNASPTKHSGQAK